MKFKVGDRVICKSGATYPAAIDKVGTVLGLSGLGAIGVQYDECIGGHDCGSGAFLSGKLGHCMWSREDELELVTRKYPTIIITTDGTTTFAMMRNGKEIVRTATAKCSPSDTFSHALGAHIALERLFGKDPLVRPAGRAPNEPVKRDKAAEAEPVKLYCVKSNAAGNVLTKEKTYTFVPGNPFPYDCAAGQPYASFKVWSSLFPSLAACLVPLVNRPAKVGEWIYIENISGNNRHGVPLLHGYKTGDILFVDGKKERADERGFIWGVGLMSTEYLVLDGYRPESEKPEVREAKRHAKPGEWIKIVNPCGSFGGYRFGSIMEVTRLYDDDGNVKCGEDIVVITPDEYVVFENYTPDNA